MRKLPAHKILTLLLFSSLCVVAILGASVPIFATTQSSIPILTPPTLIAWQMQPITKNETAYVLLNVTATATIETVTLYYCLYTGPSTPNCTNTFPLNNTVPMDRLFGNANGTFGRYEATLPKLAGEGEVWGEAKALDMNGQVGWSVRAPIFSIGTPDPSSSYLNMAMWVSDVEPKSMNLTLRTSVIFGDNVQPYVAGDHIMCSNQFVSIPLNQDHKFLFSSGTRDVQFLYTRLQLGHPELFPFDQYDYSCNLVVPSFLNASNILFNGRYLNVTILNPGLIQPEPLTIPDSLDDSYWNITSQVQYVGRNPKLGTQPYVSIDITITRKGSVKLMGVGLTVKHRVSFVTFELPLRHS